MTPGIRYKPSTSCRNRIRQKFGVHANLGKGQMATIQANITLRLNQFQSMLGGPTYRGKPGDMATYNSKSEQQIVIMQAWKDFVHSAALHPASRRGSVGGKSKGLFKNKKKEKKKKGRNKKKENKTRSVTFRSKAFPLHRHSSRSSSLMVACCRCCCC